MSGVLAAAASGCVIEDTGADLEIINESRYALVEINLAPVDQLSWGPDLLHGDVLLPNESLVVEDIRCDTYDVRVVDEFDRECVLAEIDLCLSSDAWFITNGTLASCGFQ
jgi:hypothetical protein